MALCPGDKIGHFEVLSLLGVGGMGEVYKARDTTLKRDVALKVLPATFLRDPERMARFQREAEVLASLDHTNIGPIYGIIDSEDSRGLVLALIEGPTLADHIEAGPLPQDEAIAIAKQIIDALEYAHDRGVVHRDLKPANVKITPDGVVKVLDFGLAKVLEDEPPKSSLTNGPANSPTLTIGHTRTGVILGTAAYMSPEQAIGRPVDRRSDIFSFGAVLYEMLTGKHAFAGATTPDVLEAVVKSDPDWSALPTGSPGYLRRLLERTLAKDRKQRLQAIGEARIALQNPSADEPPAFAPSPFHLGKLWPSIAALCLVAAVASSALWLTRRAPVPPALRFTVDAPPNMQFTNRFAATAISPDGRYLAFGAAAAGTATPLLWLRPLDSLGARQLPGTEGANTPFWSPDSKSIAFFAGGKLKRVDILGGAPLVLCDATQQGSTAVGGTWNRNGDILFGSEDGLHRVSASGGTLVVLTKVDASRQETGHGYPQFLPDGKHFLYFVQSGNPNVGGVYTASLDRPQQPTQIVRTDAKALYAPPFAGRPGYLLWLRGQTLLAQIFDAGKLRLEGDPSPTAEDVAVNPSQRAAFWTSDAGLLVYRSGQASVKSKMLWMSRDGKRIDQVGPEDDYGAFHLSPDGKRMALSRSDGSGSWDLWVFEFGRSVMTRLTFDGKGNTQPVWSPDGRQIAFLSTRTGTEQLYRKDAAGEGKDEQLTENQNHKVNGDWSPDHRSLLFYQVNSRGEYDLSALPLEGIGKPLPVAQMPGAPYDGAQFSPDGKWIAYESVESGRIEIYIRPFTAAQSSPVGKWQVSSQGGVLPRWRGDGKELFYVSTTRGITNNFSFTPPRATKMMAVSVRASAAGMQPDTPRELFPVSFPTDVASPYDVSSDGQRFLVLESTGVAPTAAPLTVVLNWQASLKP